MGKVVKNELCESNDISSEDIYDKLKFGDFIIAKRYNDEQQKQKIMEGHEIGPYVVVGKNTNGNVLCFYSSGVLPKGYKKRDCCFPLKLSDLNLVGFLNKDTYMNTNEIVEVNKSRFIKRICTLDPFLIKQLKKRIMLNKVNNDLKNGDNVNDFSIPIEEGDIIELNGELYLVLAFEYEEAICLPLLKENTGEIIKIGNREYNVDFDKLELLNSLEKAKRIGFIDNEFLLMSILKRIEKHFKYKRDCISINRGSLVEYNDILYYVYGDEKNFWLVYEVYSELVNKKFANVIIAGSKYFTCFECLKIDKTDTSCRNLALANEKEIDYNKKVKRVYLSRKKHKVKKEEIKFSKVEVGTYVRRFINEEKHIVVWRNDDIVIAVDEYDFYTKKYHFRKYNLRDLIAEDKFSQDNLYELLANVKDSIADIVEKNTDECFDTEDDVLLKKITS